MSDALSLGRRAGFIVHLLILNALFLFSLTAPSAGAMVAETGGSAAELKQQAQDAYIGKRYEEALAANSLIAENFPGTEERRYAVIMLGNIYEENLVDLQKAIKWDREFLDKYTDYRQEPAYRDKIAFLEKLLPQEQAFKEYQAIRFSGPNDDILVGKFEEFLKKNPDFLLQDKIRSDLANAYLRLDKRQKSFEEFEAISSKGGENKLSGSDRATFENVKTYWWLSSRGAWIAWALIAALWGAVLLMKPWKNLGWATSRKFLIWPVAWLIFTGACLPLYYKLETSGYPIVIPISTAIIAMALNLVILFWLLLLSRGDFWRPRSGALRLSWPILTLVMTGAVYYLFVVYHPQGPYIVDVFTDKYTYWEGEFREHGLTKRIIGIYTDN